MCVWPFHYRIFVKYIFELDFVQASQIALQRFISHLIHRKEERRPGMRSGSAKTCLSWRSIIAIALPYNEAISFIFYSYSSENF